MSWKRTRTHGEQKAGRGWRGRGEPRPGGGQRCGFWERGCDRAVGKGFGVSVAGMNVQGRPFTDVLWTAEVTGFEQDSEVLPLAWGDGPKGRSWRWGLRQGPIVSSLQVDEAAISSLSKFLTDGPASPPTNQLLPSSSLPPSLPPFLPPFDGGRSHSPVMPPVHKCLCMLHAPSDF